MSFKHTRRTHAHTHTHSAFTSTLTSSPTFSSGHIQRGISRGAGGRRWGWWLWFGAAVLQRIVGNRGEANESPPDGLLPGIATHLWLLSSRCRGNSGAWWEKILLFEKRSVCVCVRTHTSVCVFMRVYLNLESQTPRSWPWYLTKARRHTAWPFI